jgi:hypothetical protein
VSVPTAVRAAAPAFAATPAAVCIPVAVQAAAPWIVGRTVGGFTKAD